MFGNVRFPVLKTSFFMYRIRNRCVTSVGETKRKNQREMINSVAALFSIALGSTDSVFEHSQNCEFEALVHEHGENSNCRRCSCRLRIWRIDCDET